MKSLLLAILTGVLFALALPPFDQAWLAWFAAAPLLIGSQERRPLEAIGLGLISGVIAGFVHVGLAGDTTARLYGYLPYMYVAGIFCVQAVAGAVFRRYRQGAPWMVFIACLGVALEWLTSFSPLPVTIALSQFQSIPLIQIDALTGLWGISFLLWLANAAIAETILSRRLRVSVVALPAAMAIAAVCYGYVSAAYLKTGPVLRVAAIQDHDLNETQEFAPAPLVDNTPDRETLTREAKAKGAVLAVWSEGCLGSSFSPNAPNRLIRLRGKGIVDQWSNPTETLARQLGMYLVVGFTQEGRPKGYNCAGLVGPSGTTLSVYHKIHLFGGEAQSFEAGHDVKAVPTSIGRVGMEICFDSCFADITRRLARNGAQMVAVPNFDPLTEHGDLHRLHSALLPLRAVENRVAIVRSDPNGHSLIVAPDGRILADAPMWTAGAFVADVPLGSGQGTFYSRWGDWLAYLCTGSGVLMGAWVLLRRKRRPGMIPLASEEAAPMSISGR